jgi:hypothetical protein
VNRTKDELNQQQPETHSPTHQQQQQQQKQKSLMKGLERPDLEHVRDMMLLGAIVGFASGMSEGYRRGLSESSTRLRNDVTVMRAQGQPIDGAAIAREHQRTIARSMARTSARWLVVVPLFAASFAIIDRGLSALRDGQRDELNPGVAGAIVGAAVGVRLKHSVAGWTAAGRLARRRQRRGGTRTTTL